MILANIPKWQSHKVVHADKIVGTSTRPLGEPIREDDTFTDWILACGEIIPVSQEMRRRAPEDPIGGYYMLYKDGFESWSPEEAMLDGYTRIIE